MRGWCMCEAMRLHVRQDYNPLQNDTHKVSSKRFKSAGLLLFLLCDTLPWPFGLFRASWVYSFLSSLPLLKGWEGWGAGATQADVQAASDTRTGVQDPARLPQAWVVGGERQSFCLPSIPPALLQIVLCSFLCFHYSLLGPWDSEALSSIAFCLNYTAGLDLFVIFLLCLQKWKLRRLVLQCTSSSHKNTYLLYKFLRQTSFALQKIRGATWIGAPFQYDVRSTLEIFFVDL